MQRCQHLYGGPCAHLQATTQGAQFFVQFDQRFAHKFKVLQSRIGLRPQIRLNDVEAQHRPLVGGVHQRRVVVQAQVAFEPDHPVSHSHILVAVDA